MKCSHQGPSDKENNHESQQKKMRPDNEEVFRELDYLMRLIQAAKDADPNLLTTSPVRPDLIQAENRIFQLLPLLKTPAASDDVMPENN